MARYVVRHVARYVVRHVARYVARQMARQIVARGDIRHGGVAGLLLLAMGQGVRAAPVRAGHFPSSLPGAVAAGYPCGLCARAARRSARSTAPQPPSQAPTCALLIP